MHIFFCAGLFRVVNACLYPPLVLHAPINWSARAVLLACRLERGWDRFGSCLAISKVFSYMHGEYHGAISMGPSYISTMGRNVSMSSSE